MSDTPPLTLSLDTTGPTQALAVCRGPEPLAELTVHRPPASHTETLMANIDRLLAAVGVSPRQLDRVAACTGPGSFSGIRIGLATALGISHALQIPLFGQDALALLAELPTLPDGLVCPLLDAGRGAWYTAIYRRDGRRPTLLRPPTEVPAGQFVEWMGESGPVTLVGSGSFRLADSDRPASWSTAVHPANLAPTLAVWANAQLEPTPRLDACYIRPPDIRRPAAHRQCP